MGINFVSLSATWNLETSSTFGEDAGISQWIQNIELSKFDMINKLVNSWKPVIGDSNDFVTKSVFWSLALNIISE